MLTLAYDAAPSDLPWEPLDEMLDAVLFVLLGLDIAVIAFAGKTFLAALSAIVVCLLRA